MISLLNALIQMLRFWRKILQEVSRNKSERLTVLTNQILFFLDLMLLLTEKRLPSVIS